jgi:hypothetical protein
MSWDMAIVKIREGFGPVAEVKSDDYVPLAPLQAVQTAIRNAFPSARWSSPTWVVYSGKDLASGKEFAIEFSLDGVESPQAISVHAHGPGDPVSSLLSLTKPNGWLIVDCSSGQFIDPENPPQEG